MGSTESPLNLVRGPAKKPGWAQLVRLGGDRVAILFDELRKQVGRIDGVVERLHYSAADRRWVVQYQVGGDDLFTARILPGLLEASMPLSAQETGALLGARNLSGAIRETLRGCASKAGSGSIRLTLKDRRTVRSFANLLRAKNRLVLNARRDHS